jgi:hypothetical protein
MNPWVAIPTFLATLAWVGVVVLYWMRAKWWKSTIGWNTMGISFFIALALARLSYTHVDGVASSTTSVWLVGFGFFIYNALAFFGFQRFYLIEQSQRRKARGIAAGNLNRRWDDPR